MNINQLNDELLEVRAAVAERARLVRDLERAKESLREERDQLARLVEGLRAEDDDVRRLESASLVGLFYAVMGRRETRLEEERRELLAAKLKHDNSQRQVETLERDVADLSARLVGKERLESRYEALLVEKERLLQQDAGDYSRQLSELADELAGLRSQERELDEALQAGRAAEAGLRKVVEALDSASGWGTWDMLGGGMLASAVKHSKLDEANTAVQRVQPLLQRFERELADVGSQAGLTFESDGLTTFADIFFDGLLIDLMVQSRINESLKAARDMHSRVGGLVYRLERSHKEVQQKAQALDQKRRGLLEQV